MSQALLVTGASGQLGRRVVELLLEAKLGRPIVALSRQPGKLDDLARLGVEVRAADFDDPASLPTAFRGVGRALLVSTDAIGRRVAQHRAAIDAAARAGVAQLVYTSLPNPGPENEALVAPDHRETEAALVASPLGFTVLRNNLYIDLGLPAAKRAVGEGVLVGASGEGRAAFVTREDCARAAAAALAAEFSERRFLDVTGPAALSAADVAAVLAEVSGRPVIARSIPAAALRDGLVAAGIPAGHADVIVSFEVARASGRLATVSTAVRDLTGREPTSVAAFFRAHL